MEFNFSISDAFQLAAQKTGIEGWKGYLWEAVGDDNLVTGCVPDGVYSKGPRKGRPRFSRPIAGTEKRIVVSKAELIATATEYEQNGNCWNCKRTGKVWFRWTSENGTEYKTCDHCNGSGKSSALNTNIAQRQ